MPVQPSRIAIVGSGSIGAGWAITFARAGCAVVLNDVSVLQLEKASQGIATRLDELAEFGLAGDGAETVLSRIRFVESRTDAVAEADLVLEAAPEVLELKRSLFEGLASETSPETVLASSSSAITISQIAGGLGERHRCLVAHPGNPPYLLPVVELVPGAFTAREIVSRAKALFELAGMSAVTLGKEVEGFVFNRLQGAMLREAYCLVRDGVIGVDDLDAVVREGLGMRYAFIGPFETSDLNVRGGIAAHAARMAQAYERMGAERGQHDPWTPDLVADVDGQRRAKLSLDDWEARVGWRDRRLMALSRLKADLEASDG